MEPFNVTSNAECINKLFKPYARIFFCEIQWSFYRFRYISILKTQIKFLRTQQYLKIPNNSIFYAVSNITINKNRYYLSMCSSAMWLIKVTTLPVSCNENQLYIYSLKTNTKNNLLDADIFINPNGMDWGYVNVRFRVIPFKSIIFIKIRWQIHVSSFIRLI